MKDTRMTIQSIQDKIDKYEVSIFEIEGIIEIKKENGEDISQSEREMEALAHKIIDAQNEIKGHENS